MMTSKRVFGVLAVVLLLAVSATGAEAGAGGSPSTLTSFFLCKSIGGDSPNRRVDVDSQDTSGAGWSQTLANVKLGVATLACRFARLYPGGTTTHTACPNPNGCNEIDPGTQILGDLKCYTVSVGRGQTSGVPNPPPSYTTHDALLPTDDNVTGSSVQYICAPAAFQPNF